MDLLDWAVGLLRKVRSGFHRVLEGTGADWLLVRFDYEAGADAARQWRFTLKQ
jgi:hypothetical protein